MKICFLAHNLGHDNGAGVFSRRLIEGLRAEYGVQEEVFTTVAGNFPGEHVILGPSWIKLILAIPKIRRSAKSADVVHALDAFPYGVLASVAVLGLGKPVVITAAGTGGINVLYHKGIRGILLKAAYRRANRITAISEYTKKMILAKCPELTIGVINHGVDIEEFRENREYDPEVIGSGGRRYRVRSLAPYLLSVGSLRWRKGYKLSLQAFAELTPRFPKLKYVIVGKRYADKFFNELEGIIESLGIKDRVVFLDSIESRRELLALYRGAEVFGLLSQNMHYDVEGFGLVFLEAAASGLPVVGSRDCGVDDAVLDGKNGILVNHRDAHGFADAIASILSDGNRQKKMSEESLAFAARCTWNDKIKEYKKVYNELISG